MTARRVQDNLSAALDYAALGYAVFPLLPREKVPLPRSRGFKDATTNPATIRRWWRAQPDYNIAIATGLRSKVWALDVDGDLGATALAAREAAHGELPPTLCSTSSNGTHFWFQCDRPLRSSADRVGRCIDVRADDGYVVVPPSIHPDGPAYTWRNGRPPAMAPSWLLDLTNKRQQTISERAIAVRRPLTLQPNGYGMAALHSEIELLANTPPGSRNHALNRASFSLHQLVAGGELDRSEVHARLLEAATVNGLMSDPEDGPRSVERTIESGARAGLQHPRNRRRA